MWILVCLSIEVSLQLAFADEMGQISKDTSSSPMTRTTGRRTLSSRFTRMLQPFSNWVEKTSISTVEVPLTEMDRFGMIYMLRTL